MKVSIIGVTGYSGIELVRILSRHPNVEICSIHSHSQKTTELSDYLPHLNYLLDLPLEAIDAEKIMDQADLVFLATPSGISKKVAQTFIKADFPIIDLSGDFRLKAADQYEKWYKNSSAPLETLQKAHYGLADFYAKPASKLIANPGCYATGTLLSLAPLIQRRMIEKDSVIVDAKSGLSGAGKKLSSSTHFVTSNENMTLYKMNSHQHIPEIMQQLQKWDEEIPAIQFSTSLIPVTRGIFITTYAKSNEHLTQSQLWQTYQNFYQEKPFVRVQKQGIYPDLRQVIGSNFCDIGVAYNEVTKIITVVTVLDNLVKGAAGQAVQNLNHFAGWSEETGLDLVPIYP
ncbi:N-acetyl-gamma-glutamyl-phosphate reductase [Enterococcus dongliensis]|uniref:N-acetyl-gamma-glutamyl-phosphate reductase n=1 Tax=Enterococcus dongliensis TaxID=2559925 RepID=A0AAP5NG43_9ENTE|nr:N-acetyl-gamma-glutamyl-phosphate reductase [Enterococcus dongliensis]MDT2595761.1 N-acetyl-gamma-glutamyl-phosphate reductase [Enterococcus dongliensis]MDT2602721.1 N-acetyl-gamma-glutamyl-phosphate reductase [Enterococcus dongliensis]MDT2633791.1 N-acetyl-gamma-glutamyl-phosphate reductase [Enterococcus dongliensis]MDT2636374.1 N-acetyl-gamma-glutamyl-phosphate reductase [Enterococcus dongliensis]MDT2639883.1 N-acetyl-gamma-glutamyl-phosphate reductase [Enterococcus dongliensis]